MKDNRSHEISVGGGFNGSIFIHITSVENIFAAWREFKKGKGRKPDVINFSLNLENNIFRLREELIAGTWACDGYKKFYIKDPKPRIIHKATVRDRVLYQAIYRILYPIFDSTFIFDSYSSRKANGTHAGIRRLNVFLRKLSQNYTQPVYALKCDIKKFFDSVDHAILLALIMQKIDCPETLALLAKIIDSFHKTPGKGLPLGNVTSQIFANIYLNSFDWYIKKELGIQYYVRYCDDFIILSSNKITLFHNIRHIECYLNDKLELSLHPDKIMIRKFHQGIDFLGWVIFPHHRVLRTTTKRRIFKNLSKSPNKESLASYLGMLKHGNTYKIRKDLMYNYFNDPL